ncbi:hypothetical protein CBM2586_U50003 [Cupriavidus phytorum]|uniref:Uncharacterized protein n=1 Tax=Cupriavidus taiwanensis TaxID=164546 RepID=A0A375CT38_9BURK|nr:hypothetical protein CBM2586_U50003 [Cupriavidus taiwanensis]
MINAAKKVAFVPTVAHGIPVWALVGLGRLVRLTEPLQVLDNYQLPAGELGQLLGIEYQEGRAMAMVQFDDRIGSYEGVMFDQVELV